MTTSMQVQPFATAFAVLLTGAASLQCSSSDAAPAETPSLWPAAITCTAGAPSATVQGFKRLTLDSDLQGAAFAVTGDLNRDGKLDIVVSSFGALAESGGQIALEPGQVHVYLQGDSLDCWSKQPIVTKDQGLYFPNLPSLYDIDGDGDLDVSVPSGFFACKYSKTPGGNCGGLVWMENRGGPWVKHDVVANGSAWFFHSAVWTDFDGDGVADLVSGAEQSDDAQLEWFKGNPNAPSRVNPEPLILGKGGGGLPRVADVDGDGDLDVASSEYFANFEQAEQASFVWFERTAAPTSASPAGSWTRHKIDTANGRAMMLQPAPNLFGDGVLHWLGANHTNATGSNPGPASGVFVYDVPSDPKQPWTARLISEGIVSRPTVGLAFMAAPGLIGQGDIDGDGDLDIAVAGDGDLRTFWLEQTQPGQFSTHVLETSLGQASGATVVDLNGDGKNELVFTGYEDNVVYVYTR